MCYCVLILLFSVSYVRLSVSIYLFLCLYLSDSLLLSSLYLPVTIIANLPCGLPATVTACLLIVAERMRGQNVFVKKLDSIETLGACSLICTDKTGTLTRNIMSVSHVWVLEENSSSALINQPPLMTAGRFEYESPSI